MLGCFGVGLSNHLKLGYQVVHFDTVPSFSVKFSLKSRLQMKQHVNPKIEKLWHSKVQIKSVGLRARGKPQLTDRAEEFERGAFYQPNAAHSLCSRNLSHSRTRNSRSRPKKLWTYSTKDSFELLKHFDDPSVVNAGDFAK